MTEHRIIGHSELREEMRAVARGGKPAPEWAVAELAEMSGRAAPNLTRTLAKLEAVGFVKMLDAERRKIPTIVVHRLRVEIDPFSQMTGSKLHKDLG